MSDESLIHRPVAKREPHITEIHGDSLVDYYFWLREKTNPEVIAYLEAENAYTDTTLRATEPLQKALYDEMLARIEETDLTVPYREGDYYYYTRTIEGKQYPIHCRKLADDGGATDAPEQITLELNQLAVGHSFLGLDSFAVSPNGRLLAYTLDTTGFREYTLQIKDLAKEETWDIRVEKVSSLAWADDETLFYVTDDSAKRPYRLFRLELENLADHPTGELVYEEENALFHLSVEVTRSRAYIVATSESTTATEVRYISTAAPDSPATVVEPRQPDHRYYLDHRGDLLYIRTDLGAKNFRVMTAPIDAPQREHWREFIEHRPAVHLESIDLFANHLVLLEREDGLPHLRITNLTDGATHRLSFPEPVYTAAPSHNREFNTKKFRFSYQSFTTPSSIFDYDMETGERELLKQTKVLGDYNPDMYQSERIFAAAPDGVRVPISLVYRKPSASEAQVNARPLLLYGYGAYGITMPIRFSTERLSLLNRGIVYAIAHIRGGGDLGEPWHDAGKMMQKRNTFSDFIASAEHLINRGWTSPSQLVIEGGSAGGLLMGAVVNWRPDLFKAVISHVPFVDVVNTMLDSSLPLTVGEYLEWGNPNIKQEYDYIKSYCPYTNIEPKSYPTMLIKTGLNDSQVMYWEPAKYVAKLRSTRTDGNLLLLKTNMGAGHGGASGRYDHLKEIAFNYAFILMQLGLADLSDNVNGRISDTAPLQ